MPFTTIYQVATIIPIVQIRKLTEAQRSWKLALGCTIVTWQNQFHVSIWLSLLPASTLVSSPPENLETAHQGCGDSLVLPQFRSCPVLPLCFHWTIIVPVNFKLLQGRSWAFSPCQCPTQCLLHKFSAKELNEWREEYEKVIETKLNNFHLHLSFAESQARMSVIPQSNAEICK